MYSVKSVKIQKIAYPMKIQCRQKTIFHRGVRFFFKRNLLLTNSITSGGFMALGDLIQQEIENQYKLLPTRYDWGRLGRMLTVGTLLGPVHHFYYLNLDKIMPKVTVKTVFYKVACDQLFASPATILCFFYGMDFLENKTFQQSTDEIKQKFKYVYLGDCIYWPPIQCINFYFLPPQYRVFYINIATMVFNVFMSFMKHHDLDS